ncbi:MAG: hypothetical protein JNL70_26185 [Saprospiraceae bacterium]|nr:hypothetical protein [Saprospiraceae bacterium]
MTSLSYTSMVFVSIQYIINNITKHQKLFVLILFLLSNRILKAQTLIREVTIASSSCSTTIEVCENDTVTLVPQNLTNYTNYRWYAGSVTPATQITAATATVSNVVITNFMTNFPTIQVVSNGGIYILTSEYSTGTNCSTINDTITLHFSKRPIVQTVVEKNIVCVGSSVILNATLLAGSGTCSFQWQNSTDGMNWSNIQGATNNIFITPPLSNSTRYALKRFVQVMLVVINFENNLIKYV